MSGITDKTAQATGIMNQVQSKVDSLIASTTDPALISQLQAVSANITSGVGNISSAASSASSSIAGMFSPSQAASTTGLNMVLQCVCQGMAGDLSKDFMTNLGDLYEGAGLDQVTAEAQAALDFVNSISAVTSQTVQQIASYADEMIQKGVDTLGEVASAVGDATGITSVAKEAAQAMGMMGVVMSSCVPKQDLFGIPSVKGLFDTPLMQLSVDIGLNSDDMAQASCQMLGQSGLMDQASSLQNSMNEKLNNLRG